MVRKIKTIGRREKKNYDRTDTNRCRNNIVKRMKIKLHSFLNWEEREEQVKKKCLKSLQITSSLYRKKRGKIVMIPVFRNEFRLFT